jgi:hypothetical protein
MSNGPWPVADDHRRQAIAPGPISASSLIVSTGGPLSRNASDRSPLIRPDALHLQRPRQRVRIVLQRNDPQLCPAIRIEQDDAAFEEAWGIEEGGHSLLARSRTTEWQFRDTYGCALCSEGALRGIVEHRHKVSRSNIRGQIAGASCKGRSCRSGKRKNG